MILGPHDCLRVELGNSVSMSLGDQASVLRTDLLSVYLGRLCICEDRLMEPAKQASLAAAGVTAREAEVLAVIGSRLTNQEIAERLYISVRTVESHVSALLRKLGLGGRPAPIQLAQRLAAERALPIPLTSFVGREQDLALLRDLLVTSPRICLSGPAGCGKSRLALETRRERW